MNNNKKIYPVFSNANVDEHIEMIPILSDDENKADEKIPEVLSILPVRNFVLFPSVVFPITVGRKKAIKLVKNAFENDQLIGVITQKNQSLEDPGTQDLHKIGTVAKILKVLTLPEGNITIIIQGKQRFSVKEYIQEQPHLKAEINILAEKFPAKNKKEIKALISSLKEAASKILSLSPEIPQQAQIAIENIDNPSFLVHFLSSNLNADIAEKQKLLEINDSRKRATTLLEYMLKDIQLLELKQEIQTKVSSDLDQQQRDYFLRQQMKVLQDELGFGDFENDIEELQQKASRKKWDDKTVKHFNKELSKLARLNPGVAEFTLQLNYIELMLELPWNTFTKDKLDLKKAAQILDKDHFGLDKVKQRILEYLAVLKLKNNMRGPILCLYGPPGVGKTSLGKSIAKSLNRKFIRFSLGGLHDEAEIRGHRKTYIGAMPGKVIQNIKKSGASNPVFILDEIDKISSDFRGDPASALLEVLDPEQNNTFVDNYLEIEYDLSKVLFIATANTIDSIHPALRDRMEMIEVSGYTVEEKIQIAKKHLIPKQRKEHGLEAGDIKFSESAIRQIIEGYTRESGVRNLEREIAAVMRKIAKLKAMEEDYSKSLKAEEVIELLAAPKFLKDKYQENISAGVVTGLAWTSVGGEVLFIESSLSKGKGKLTISGQLGEVMKESASTALSYLKANASFLNIDYRIFEQYDLHIHVPEGAVPKDGPSAGITIFTALASLYTQRKVKDKLAMTGEITLSGKVLPVGGIKEKILAAKRYGIKDIVISLKNKKDIEEINENYLRGLQFHYVDLAYEVLDVALLKEKVKNPVDLQITESKNNI